ncbi:MAG: hypothetical protein GXX85_13305 [Ignavibacteria bacterium]|nr:hypothetical protein [Ignavibacteria bacterium]
MGNKTEKEIINFFLSDASLIELMLAIRKNDLYDFIEENKEKYFIIGG